MATIISARYPWYEYDDTGDAERVYALCETNMLWPAIIITTGTVPDQRDHLYFRQDMRNGAAHDRNAAARRY
jgi:hypothetical protein